MTKNQVSEIEELLIAGLSRREIAQRFGVSRRTIWTIDGAMQGCRSPGTDGEK
jgi:transposase